MNTTRNKDGPDPNERGQRRCFGRPAATPSRQEESDPSLAFPYGIASGQEGGSPSDTGLAESMGNQTLGMTSNHDVLADYEVEAGGYFSRVGLTLVGAPDDDGRRARLVHDMLWGRWSQPTDGDAGNVGTAHVAVPERPPGLKDGAAAPTDTPERTDGSTVTAEGKTPALV